MECFNATSLHRIIGAIGHPAFAWELGGSEMNAVSSSEWIYWLNAVEGFAGFFGPGTLGRTWGTRPAPIALREN
jgi:hypothetical protein